MTEVRVHAGGERQAARQTVFEIRTRRWLGVVGPVERVRRVAWRTCELRAEIRHHLEPARGWNVDEAGEITFERNETRIGRLPRRPAVALIATGDVAHDLETPDSFGTLLRAAKPQLRKRDPVFGGPAERIDPGGDLPDGIPVQVFTIAIVKFQNVFLHPARVD